VLDGSNNPLGQEQRRRDEQPAQREQSEIGKGAVKKLLAPLTCTARDIGDILGLSAPK
jgi:hypothetical protein